MPLGVGLSDSSNNCAISLIVSDFPAAKSAASTTFRTSVSIIALLSRRVRTVVGNQMQCTIRARRAHVQRRVRFDLHHVDQALAHQLQNRDERYGDALASFFEREQRREFQ